MRVTAVLVYQVPTHSTYLKYAELAHVTGAIWRGWDGTNQVVYDVSDGTTVVTSYGGVKDVSIDVDPGYVPPIFDVTTAGPLKRIDGLAEALDRLHAGRREVKLISSENYPKPRLSNFEIYRRAGAMSSKSRLY